MYGREKRWGEADWKRRLGYAWLGEVHVPGRLRTWHVIKALRRLRLWDSRPRALYDAGGGEGGFAYYVARRFPAWTVVVGDNAVAALERGRRIKARLGLPNLDIREVDLRQPGDEACYDVVVCADVLEHIEEDDVVVKHLAHALKPGGVLVVTAPSVPQPRHLSLVAWRERRIGFNPSDYGHVRPGYSTADLHRMFENVGLEPETVTTTFGRFGTLMFDLFFVTGDNRPNPVVFMALFPVYLALAGLDLAFPGRGGAAVFGVGRKPRPRDAALG
jgi:SAM-dependent methyltransferase